MDMQADIKLTPAASQKIKQIIASEAKNASNAPKYLRVAIQGGGCAGFKYGFSLDNELSADDFSVRDEQQDVTVLIDSASMQYLAGAEIDYEEKFDSASLVLRNPNAKATCGCGSSFAA